MSAERFLRVGCAGLPPRMARKSYFEKLHFLEDETTFFAPPDAKVMTRWRKECAPTDVYAVHAWQLVTHEASAPSMKRLPAPLDAQTAREIGGLRATPRVADAWQKSVAAARAVGAKAIVLETPTAFATGSTSRDALRRFVGEIAADRGDLAVVWDPRGMWEPRSAASLAADLGLLYAWDPLVVEPEDAPPPTEEAYFRLHGLGLHRNRFSEARLEALAVHVEGAERAWVVFANAARWADARRFLVLAAELGLVDAAGLEDEDDDDEDQDEEDVTDAEEADDDGDE